LKRQIRIACPDCRKLFTELRNLNQHITKTGHNDNCKFSQIDVMRVFATIDEESKTKKISITLHS